MEENLDIPLSAVFYPSSHQDNHIKLSESITDDQIPEAQILSQIKEHQKSSICMEKAMIKLNKGDPVQGIVAISNHFVYIFFIQDRIKLIISFHMFRLFNYRVKPHKLFIFARPSKPKDSNFEIVNCHIISKPDKISKLAHTLRRNYLLATYVFEERCKFQVGSKDRDENDHDPFVDEYPPLDLHLSISQRYQFTYSAFCSYMDIPYYHEIVLDYHDRIRSFDGIFDYSFFPDYITQNANFQNILLSSVFPFQYVPAPKGIICHHLKLPYVAKSLSVMLKQNSSSRFIHLVDCNISARGINEIGKALKDNQPIQYFNFSLNELGNIDEFFTALEKFQTPVFYLNFGRTHLNNLFLLFHAIKNNQNLHKLKYLYFNGCTSPQGSIQPFIELLQDKKLKNLKSLGVGGDPNDICYLFKELITINKHPISELSLSGIKITKEITSVLKEYIENSSYLTILDLSYSECEPEDLEEIIQCYGTKSPQKQLSIRLNGLLKSFDTKKADHYLLFISMGFLYTKLGKWKSVELADNMLTSYQFRFCISWLKRMINLEELDLSKNFSPQDIGSIPQALSELKNMKQLTKLRLVGSDTFKLNTEQLTPVLEMLKERDDMEEIDLSNNDLQDQGLEELNVIFQNNKSTLEKVGFHNNQPQNFDSISLIIKTCLELPNLISGIFPSKDGYLLSHDPIDRSTLFKLRLQFIDKLRKNRNSKNLKGILPFEAPPELLDIAHLIYNDMKEELDEQSKSNVSSESDIYHHSGICIDMNLPLPNLFEGDDISSGGEKVKIKDNGQDLIYSPNIIYEIQEEPIQDSVESSSSESRSSSRPNSSESRSSSRPNSSESRSSSRPNSSKSNSSSKSKSTSNSNSSSDLSDTENHFKTPTKKGNLLIRKGKTTTKRNETPQGRKTPSKRDQNRLQPNSVPPKRRH